MYITSDPNPNPKPMGLLGWVGLGLGLGLGLVLMFGFGFRSIPDPTQTQPMRRPIPQLLRLKARLIDELHVTRPCLLIDHPSEHFIICKYVPSTPQPVV
jgi:hypothetical protein